MILYLHGLKKKKHSAPTECRLLKYNNKYMLTNASGQISPGKITPVTLALLPEPNFQPMAILWLPWNLPRELSHHSQVAPDNRTRGFHDSLSGGILVGLKWYIQLWSTFYFSRTKWNLNWLTSPVWTVRLRRTKYNSYCHVKHCSQSSSVANSTLSESNQILWLGDKLPAPARSSLSLFKCIF